MSLLEIQRGILEQNLSTQEGLALDIDEQIDLLTEEKETLTPEEFEESIDELSKYKIEVLLGVEISRKLLTEFDKNNRKIVLRHRNVLRREANYGK